MYVLEPTPYMITLSVVHRTQIIYHADIALLMGLLDVRPGKIVVEAGTGSGSVSQSLGAALRPTGKLHTFEFNAERKVTAQREFDQCGWSDVISVECRDVCTDGLPSELQDKVDSCFFDIPEPWAVVEHANKCLVQQGRIVTFSPCIEQIQRTASALRRLHYHGIRVFECLSKPWGVRGGQLSQPRGVKRARDGESCREAVESYQLPMRGHTSYLLLAIRPLDDELRQIA
mmetsp:Transcript_80196/g.214254  ORF Transcript_80196/g.214254 Transcript_80196/m.214254 type:complete len:230 (+) Transcript_80196:301-990(+)